MGQKKLLTMLRRVMNFFAINMVQRITFITYCALLFTLFLIRDFFQVPLHDVLFLIVITITFIVSNKQNLLLAFLFLIPLIHGLPYYTVISIFALFLVIKNRFRLNLASIVFPLVFVIFEVTLYFAYLRDRDSLVEDLKVIFFFAVGLFIFFYIICDWKSSYHVPLLTKGLMYGLFAFAFICILIDIKYSFYVSQNSISAMVTLRSLLLSPSNRFFEPRAFVEWCNQYLRAPDRIELISNQIINNNPNQVGVYAGTIIALFIYQMSRGNKEIKRSIVYMLLLGFIGVLTRSRMFLLMVPVIYILTLICLHARTRFRKLSMYLLLIIPIVALVIAYPLVDQDFSFIKNLFYRFDFENEEHSFNTTGRIDLFIQYAEFWVTTPLTFLFGGSINFVYDVSRVAMTGNYPEDVIHFGPTQLLYGNGLLGTVIIVVIFYFIFKTRYTSNQRGSIFRFFPFIIAIIFSFAGQLFTPMTILFRLTLCILVFNDGEAMVLDTKMKQFWFKNIICQERSVIPTIHYPFNDAMRYVIATKSQLHDIIKEETALLLNYQMAAISKKERRHYRHLIKQFRYLRKTEFYYHQNDSIRTNRYFDRYLDYAKYTHLYYDINYCETGAKFLSYLQIESATLN
ncbi:MAG: hypothetical protein LBR37_01030 [Erysipelotrichaceae bacterium]|jgi:hypothetical protein|nr:hypothetical protein [Erysipelotrichaceae bacterium]